METTFPRLMLEHAQARPQAPALREKEYGIWQTTTWRALADEVAALACGMAEAGLSAGQHIVIVGDNRPRLYACMLAAQSLGAIPVPLYQDAVAAEMAFPINNAEVAFAVVEDQEQVDKLIELRETCPQLARIWYDDPRGLRKYDEPGLASLDELIRAGQARQQREPGFFAAAVAQVSDSAPAAVAVSRVAVAAPAAAQDSDEQTTAADAVQVSASADDADSPVGSADQSTDATTASTPAAGRGSASAKAGSAHSKTRTERSAVKASSRDD